MRFTTPMLALAGLVLAGCASAPPPLLATPSPGSGGLAKGIDMPTDSSDVMGALKGFPIEFVARYYRDPASRWPALTVSEAQRLSSLGLKIVTVWEWHSGNPAYFTYATGYNDALNAVRQAKNVGQPPGSAIYFAVDFNARDAALYAVGQYFRGVNAGLAAAGGGRPEYRVGVYGSGAVCASMRQAGLAQYAWLSGSTAWDGTAGYDGWNIRQAPAAARFANLAFDHDANDARGDYGAFRSADYAAAAPASAVVAVAAAAPAAAATVVNTAIGSIVPPAAAAAPPPAPPAPPAGVAAAPSPPPAPPVVASATPTASPPPAPPVVASAAPAASLPPTPPAASPPPAPVVALATPSALPRFAATSRPPKPESAAAEVAEAVAEEPAVHEAPGHERSRAHGAKEAIGSARKSFRVAVNNRAFAVPLRHPGGAAAEPREAERKALASRRSHDRPPHLPATKASMAQPLDERAVRHGAVQKRSERRHHEANN